MVFVSFIVLLFIIIDIIICHYHSFLLLVFGFYSCFPIVVVSILFIIYIIILYLSFDLPCLLYSVQVCLSVTGERLAVAQFRDLLNSSSSGSSAGERGSNQLFATGSPAGDQQFIDMIRGIDCSSNGTRSAEWNRRTYSSSQQRSQFRHDLDYYLNRNRIIDGQKNSCDRYSMYTDLDVSDGNRDKTTCDDLYDTFGADHNFNHHQRRHRSYLSKFRVYDDRIHKTCRIYQLQFFDVELGLQDNLQEQQGDLLAAGTAGAEFSSKHRLISSVQHPHLHDFTALICRPVAVQNNVS